MLDLTLRSSLSFLITPQIGWPIDLDLLRLLLGEDALRRQPSVQNAHQCAEWIVREALAAPDPAVLIHIVRTLDPPGAAVELHELADRLEATPEGWTGQAAEALFVPANWPFVDRHDIRSLLGRVASGVGPPAITVEAPAGQGKRTTGKYIEHLARTTQSFHPVVAEMRPQPQPGALALLADNIRHGLGLAPDSGTTHEEPERQAEVLASNIALGAYKAKKPVWFVPIVIDPDGLEEGILSFIDEMLKLLADTPTLASYLRLVLMADNVNELGLENLPPPAARIVLPDVTSDKVGEWLKAAAPGKEDALYTLAAREVLRWVNNQNPKPELRLRWLARKCDVVRRELVT